jgi:hypothetical protein
MATRIGQAKGGFLILAQGLYLMNTKQYREIHFYTANLNDRLELD